MFFDASFIFLIIVLIIFMTAVYFMIREFLIDKRLLLNYKKTKKMFDKNPNNILLKDLVDIYEAIIKKYNIK